MAKTRTAEVDIPRLCEVIRSDRKRMESMRVARREAARLVAGDQFSTETSYEKRPVNFLSLYQSGLGRSLISHDPRVLLDTYERQFKGVVSAMEIWLNEQIVKMDLATTLERAVVDGLYCEGIVLVSLATPAESESYGWSVEYGQPHASIVDVDDFVADQHAREPRQYAYAGHRSRVQLETIQDSKLYDAIKRKRLEANDDRQLNESGDERISMLSRGYDTANAEEIYDYVDLWTIWLAREKMVITLVSEDGGTPMAEDYGKAESAFAQQPWVGPDCGPYHYLRLMPAIPGNIRAKGPMQDLIDLDRDLNRTYAKLLRQAARQKVNYLASGMSPGEMESLLTAKDGAGIRCDNPERIKPLVTEGPNPNNQQFATHLWEMANKIAGNLELMLGLGQQSRTATQDKMLNANASRSVTDMQTTVVKFTAEVIESLAWFHHYHPQNVMTSYRDIPGLNRQIRQKVTPQQRQQIPFESLKLTVDPYSLSRQAPGEKLAFLNNVMTQVVMPMMPLLQQQGIEVKLDKYLEYVGQYGNSPEIEEIIDISSVPQPPMGQQDQDQQVQGDGRNQKPAMPTNSQRTYNRVNQSQATTQGNNTTMRAALLGMNAGGSPSSNGVRPVGAV